MKQNWLNLGQQTRDLLVKQRTILIQKMHGMFNRLYGIKLKKERLSSKKQLLALDLSQGTPGVFQIEMVALRDQALSLTTALGAT